MWSIFHSYLTSVETFLCVKEMNLNALHLSLRAKAHLWNRALLQKESMSIDCCRDWNATISSVTLLSSFQ